MGEAGTSRSEGNGSFRSARRNERAQEALDAIARLISGPRNPDTKDGRRRKTVGTA